MEWINLDEDTDNWRVAVNAVKNIQAYTKYRVLH